MTIQNRLDNYIIDNKISKDYFSSEEPFEYNSNVSKLNNSEFINAILKGTEAEKNIDNFEVDINNDTLLDEFLDINITDRSVKSVYKEAAYLLLTSIPINLNSNILSTFANAGVYELPYAYILYIGALYYRYKYGLDLNNNLFNKDDVLPDNITYGDLFKDVSNSNYNANDRNIFKPLVSEETNKAITGLGDPNKSIDKDKNISIDPSFITFKGEEQKEYFVSGYGIYNNLISNWEFFLYHKSEDVNNFTYFYDKVNKHQIKAFNSSSYNDKFNINFYGLYNVVDYDVANVSTDTTSFFKLYANLKKEIKNRILNENYGIDGDKEDKTNDELKESLKVAVKKSSIVNGIINYLEDNDIILESAFVNFLGFTQNEVFNLKENGTLDTLGGGVFLFVDKVIDQIFNEDEKTQFYSDIYNSDLLIHLYPSSIGIINPINLFQRDTYNFYNYDPDTNTNEIIASLVNLDQEKFNYEPNNLFFEGDSESITNTSVRFISYSCPFLGDEIILPNYDEMPETNEDNNYSKLKPFLDIIPENVLNISLNEFLKFSTPSISSLIYNSTFNFKLLLRSLMTITYEDLSTVNLTYKENFTASEQKDLLIGYDSFVTEKGLFEYGDKLTQKDINVILTNAQKNRCRKVISEFLDETIVINTQSVYENVITENNYNNISDIIFNNNFFFYDNVKENFALYNSTDDSVSYQAIREIIFNNPNSTNDIIEIEEGLSANHNLLQDYYGDINNNLLGTFNLRNSYINEWEKRRKETSDPIRKEILNKVVNVLSRNQETSFASSSIASTLSQAASNISNSVFERGIGSTIDAIFGLFGIDGPDFTVNRDDLEVIGTLGGLIGVAGVPDKSITGNLFDIIGMVSIVERLFKELNVRPDKDIIKISKPFIEYFLTLFFKNFNNKIIESIFNKHKEIMNKKIEDIVDNLEKKLKQDYTAGSIPQQAAGAIEFSIGYHIQQAFNETKLDGLINEFNVEKSINNSFNSAIENFHDELIALVDSGKNGVNSFIDGFSDELEAFLENRDRKNKEKNESEGDSISSSDLRFKTYYNIKSLYDSWISFADEEKDRDENGNIKLAFNFNKVSSCIEDEASESDKDLIDYFFIVDRAGRNIGKDTMVDLNFIVSYFGKEFDSGNLNTSFHSFIDTLLNEHGFRFHALPAYINLGAADQETLSKTFGVSDELTTLETSPAYLCQYLGDASSKPFSEQDKNVDTIGKSFCLDDNLENSDVPEDMKSGTAASFIVDFGTNEQQIFYDVNLDQSEFMDTEESIEVITNMTKNYAETAGSNLYKIYTSRSYTCKVSCLGNMMIQPLMFFYLKNIPIFEGTYWITNIKHNIVGNSIDTTFSGVRQPQSVLPSVNEVLISLNEDFVKTFGVKSELSDSFNREELLTKDKGDLKKYLTDIAKRESGGSAEKYNVSNDWEVKSKIENSEGEVRHFFGRYQFGLATIETLIDSYGPIIQRALDDIRPDEEQYNTLRSWVSLNSDDNPDLTPEKWENYSTSEKRKVFPPELQNMLMVLNLRFNLNRLNGILDKSVEKYDGEIVTYDSSVSGTTFEKQVPITKSGLLGGAHISGAGGVKAFLMEKEIRKDANDTSVADYIIRFGGYRINNVEDEVFNQPFKISLDK